MMKRLSGFLLLVLLTGCNSNSLVLESDDFLMEIDGNGRISSMKDRNSGTEYLAEGIDSPLLTLRYGDRFHLPSEMTQTEEGLRLSFPAGGPEVLVKILEKDTHLIFEAVDVEPQSAADLLVWGPYPTSISEIVGECVGVVRNQDYAIGIQSLNLKTLGGYPESEDDSMPSYNIFEGDDFSDIAEDEKELYRGNTAKREPYGSSLQAYCRDRSESRVIPNLKHDRYLAPPFDDGGLPGSRIALFGCPQENALDTIGAIELEEGLPHPIIDGVWGKTSSGSTASYLIVDFGEEDLDQALDLTEDAGLRYLYHGDPFDNWGHFDLDSDQFPDNWDSLKNCVERAERRGVNLGVHTLSNFITTNDPYVTPIPDARLGSVGYSLLSEEIGPDDQLIGIVSPEFFNQFENNSLRTVMIGEELVRYEGVTAQAPWRLTGCQRGAFGTRAEAHSEGDEITKLVDHPYRTFLAGMELQSEMAERIAELFNYTRLKQISFDGLEGCKASGMGQYARTMFVNSWYEALDPDLQGRVINDASNPGHYFWHTYTRMNWGEPWYAGFRESQTLYRLKNQNFYDRNLMPHMLGWFNMTEETTLEDAEWLLARAAAFNAGFALRTSSKVVNKNGHGIEILEAVKEWERARMAAAFSLPQRERMKSVSSEFHLEPDGPNGWLLYPVSIARHTHKMKTRQPGEPVFSSFNYSNNDHQQPLMFIITASGGDVSGIRIEIDNSKEIAVPFSLRDSESLRYHGEGTVGRYSSNWELLEEVKIDDRILTVARGSHPVIFDCSFDSGEQPEVKIEFRTMGEPEPVGVSVPTD